jgi:alkylation response protein AidB-like acyl-CoA dehydrogenase
MNGYNELNLDLTKSQIAMKEETRRFAKEVLRPASLELDKLHDPADVIKSPVFWRAMQQGYELGYHTIFLPDTYGGLAADPIETNIILEELGWGSADFAVGLGVACFPAFFAAMVPSERLVSDIIEPFCQCTDASIIGCWGITEPDHGTDILCPFTDSFHDPKIAGQTRARLEGEHYIIDGQKAAWVSNGTIATHCLLFPHIDASMGMAGGGICVVPLDLPGVKRGRPLDKLGQRALNQGEIFFDGVRIPREYMLVEPDSYESMLDITLSTANAGMSAIFVGLARAAFEEALAYAKQRVQGGKTLFEHQMIKHKLFAMFMKIEAARALSRAAMIYNYNNTPPLIQYSIAAKVFATNTAFEVASEAVQIYGGNGVSREYAPEKFFRDARASMIEDGANDSLMITAAHHL